MWCLVSLYFPYFGFYIQGIALARRKEHGQGIALPTYSENKLLRTNLLHIMSLFFSSNSSLLISPHLTHHNAPPYWLLSFFSHLSKVYCGKFLLSINEKTWHWKSFSIIYGHVVIPNGNQTINNYGISIIPSKLSIADKFSVWKQLGINNWLESQYCVGLRGI